MLSRPCRSSMCRLARLGQTCCPGGQFWASPIRHRVIEGCGTAGLLRTAKRLACQQHMTCITDDGATHLMTRQFCSDKGDPRMALQYLAIDSHAAGLMYQVMQKGGKYCTC